VGAAGQEPAAVGLFTVDGDAMSGQLRGCSARLADSSFFRIHLQPPRPKLPLVWLGVSELAIGSTLRPVDASANAVSDLHPGERATSFRS
jgi:hypothetical protein